MPASDMPGGVQGTPARPSAGPSAGPSSSQKQHQQQQLQQQQQAMNNFGFPAVGAKDLAKLLSGEMQANVTAEEISNPNATVAHKCFIAFLEGLSGVSSEFIQRQTTRAVGQMEYKEVYEQSYSQLVLFREIKEMMVCATIHDFCLQDMTRPSKIRFKRQLSALHNFWGHRHDRLVEFEDLTERSEALLVERDQLMQEIAQKEEEINKIRQQEKAEEEEVKEILAHNEVLNNTLMKLKREQETGLRDLEALTDKKEQMEKERLALEEKTHELVTEVERLKQRIRQSPDELTRNVKSAEDKLQRAKVELEEKEKVLAAQIKKRNEMLVIEEELQAAMTAMQRVQSELQRSKKELTERESILQLLSANEGELSELNFQQKQMTQKIEVDQARVERLRVALEQKRQMWEKKNLELDEIIRTVQADKAEKLKEAVEKDKVCKEIERQIEEINLKHRAQVLKMQEEKESLSRLADTYMHSVSQSLGIAV